MFDPRDVKPGDLVTVVDANGNKHLMTALSGVEPGHKFPIIRVGSPAYPKEAIPWPAESVVGRMSMPPTDTTET